MTVETAPSLATAVDDPFAALSLQLVSHGFLSRPLLLSSVLPALPSLPSSASTSSSSLKKHQELLLLRARSLDQLTKLLWNLLETNELSKQELKESVERESRTNMEFDRERILRDRVEKEKDTIARELEQEKAKTKDLGSKLKTEQERHKHCREELSKSRNALQFIKTQSLHDQKKREQEVTQLHLRLSKLGSTASSSDASTKIQILNHGTSSPSASPNGSPLYSTFIRNPANSTRRNISTPPASSPSSASTSIATELLNSEIELLKSSLVELEQTRIGLAAENVEFREFSRDLNDWIENLLEEEKQVFGDEGEDDSERYEYEEAEEDADEAMDAERKEARLMMQKLRMEQQRQLEQGFIVSPTPHLSSPTTLILPNLSTKLHILRLSLLSSLRSTSARISLERNRNLDAVEQEIEQRDQAIEEKLNLELQLEEIKKAMLENQILLEEFTEARNGGGGKPRISRLIGRDDSGDELPEDVRKDLEERKKQRKMKSASKLTSAAIEKPVTSAHSASATATATTTADRPSIPSRSVQDFLGSLGLDTPAASTSTGGAKEPLRSKELVNSAAGTTSGLKPEVSMHKPKKRSVESKSSSDPASRNNEIHKKPSVTTLRTGTTSSSRSTNVDPPPPTRTEPLSARIVPEPTTSAALSSILSLALSPPPSSEPFVSSKAASLKPTGPVLGSSRAVNTGTGPSKPKAVVKSREELIRDKKLSLLAATSRGTASIGGTKK